MKKSIVQITRKNIMFNSVVHHGFSSFINDASAPHQQQTDHRISPTERSATTSTPITAKRMHVD